MAKSIMQCQTCGKDFASYNDKSKFCCFACYGVSRRGINTEQEEKAIKLYKSGLSASAVAKEVGASLSVILSALDRNNVKRRPKWSYAQKYDTNQFAFDDLSDSRSAYWIGFIYADGYVGNDSLTVQLKESDSGHLIKLLEFLGCDSPINPQPNYSTCAMSAHGSHLIDRLHSLGIVVGRGRFSSLLAELPRWSHSHFLRGYLDGDGWISKPSEKKRNFDVGFCGQVDILKWIKITLSECTGASMVPKIRPKGTGIIHEMNYSGGQCNEILKWLYCDCDNSISLDRKRERAMFWMGKYK